MRFIAFQDGSVPMLGVRVGDELISLTTEGLPGTLDELLKSGTEGLQAAERATRRPIARRSLRGLQYLPPLQSPAKAIAVGLNYREHASETHFEAPNYPVLFHRFPSSWVAHQTPMIRPALSRQYDYEGELVVIIGRSGRHIKRSDALEHVAGYSIFNDGSVRDYQFKSAQWMIGKNFDSSGSFGPEFVTADEMPPGASGLRLQTRINGRVLQDANTRDMIFDVATLIAVCSDAMTLQPGDMIITGTPSGVGVARQPQTFLKPSDVCEVEIEGLGVLSNPIVDENQRDV
jgi:2-keto-4-pentenoate hydratase/2-oxohepta-3-ene-1,7-dioic acid hydratase in catechol pathway